MAEAQLMALPPRIHDGFLPGRHAITGYGRGGFRFADMSHQGSILVLPGGIHAVTAPEPFHHADALYEKVFEAAAEIDILIIGAGLIPFPIPEPLRWRFRDASIRADSMLTSSACSTYNVLLEEGRRVSALLVAVG
jgi:uncharacterized protein